MRRRRSAFTLIEVLVTMAVMALLAAIVLPALSAAHRRATESTCTSNLRQIGCAFAMYSADFDGLRPPRLHDLYPNYVRSPELFICPRDSWAGAGGWAAVNWARHSRPPERWPLVMSYGYFWSRSTVPDRDWKAAAGLPGRPGYAVCVLHGEARRAPSISDAPWFAGHTLRLCFDGSVVACNVDYGCARFDTWTAMTSQAASALAGS